MTWTGDLYKLHEDWSLIRHKKVSGAPNQKSQI